MKMKKFTLQLLKQHDYNFQLLVNEDNSVPVYSSMEDREVVSNAATFNFNMVEVDQIRQSETETLFRLSKEEEVLGWIQPVDSIMIIPKAKQEAKLNGEAQASTPINEALNFNMEKIEAHFPKILYSECYAIHQGKVYEGLSSRNKLIGFFLQSSINHIHRVEKDVKIIVDRLKLYEDSRMTKHVAELDHTQGQLFTLTKVVDNEAGVQLEVNERKLWSKKSNIELPDIQQPYIYENADELIIESILNQYQKKLNYNMELSLKVMNAELKKQH